MIYVLTIYRKGCRETIIRETFEGSNLAAEKRLGDLWNKYAAYDGNDRFRATMADYRTRRVLHSIN